MTPSVSSSRFPYLPILVHIGTRRTVEQSIEIEPLVDTGFDGGVVIPQALLDPSLTPDSQTIWTLADGTDVLAPAYLGYVEIGNLSAVSTAIIALGDEALLGRAVTNRFRLIFERGERIVVEP